MNGSLIAGRILIAGFVIFLVNDIHADDFRVDQETAQAMATQWLDRIKGRGVEMIKPVRRHSLIKNKTVIYHLFSLGEKGFIIVAADKRIAPIIGYSLTSPCADSGIFEDSYYSACYENLLKTAAANRGLDPSWKELFTQNVTINSPAGSAAVEPITFTEWDQKAPYNKYCPLDGSTKTIVGCVPLAVAQLMKFFEFPSHGFGSSKYWWQGDSTSRMISVEYSDHIFDWKKMPLFLENADSVGINEAAWLCMYVGASLSTNYKINGSGAFFNLWPLMEHFGYHIEYTEIPPTVNFQNVLNLCRGSLQNNLPVYFEGSSATNPGHAFIIDGFDENGLFHINWGWGGKYNGYYNLQNLVVGGYNFNSNQAMTLSFKPDSTAYAPRYADAFVLNDMDYVFWWPPRFLDAAFYKIFRNDSLIANASGSTWCRVKRPVGLDTCTYEVAAVDGNGKEYARTSTGNIVPKASITLPYNENIAIGTNNWDLKLWDFLWHSFYKEGGLPFSSIARLTSPPIKIDSSVKSLAVVFQYSLIKTFYDTLSLFDTLELRVFSKGDTGFRSVKKYYNHAEKKKDTVFIDNLSMIAIIQWVYHSSFDLHTLPVNVQPGATIDSIKLLPTGFSGINFRQNTLRSPNARVLVTLKINGKVHTIQLNKYAKGTSAIKISVCNLLGRQLFATLLKPDSKASCVSLNADHFPRGCFLIKASTANSSIAQRVVISID